MTPLRIFIGWDKRESMNYDLCEYSISKHASIPVEIIPLKQKILRKTKLYWRPDDEKAATDFSLTRFLTPYLSGYFGWSVFMDCDMIVTRDVKEILDHIDKNYAIKVVKHDYTPKESIKMDGKKQYIYPRKNWSSFILWNNAHESHKKLKPELISHKDTTASFLHRFQWLPDQEIGALPIEYNFLAGDYDKPDYLPFNIHYTNGSPLFPAYENTDFADIWQSHKDEYSKKKESIVSLEGHLSIPLSKML